MIVKKISMSHDKSKRASIADLVDYLRDPERGRESGKTGERLLYTGARGFISTTHEAQKAEMIALAEEAVRSKQPVSHYIMSWREGEQPTPEQIERAMDIFLEELGLQGHQCIYALHGDTDNVHLHIAVNRVHPERLKVVKINRGFDIEAAHRAIARIEREQGWQREHNGRYQVLENGELVRAPYDPEKPRQPDQRKRDMENRTGEKSALRIAQEQAVPIIRRAQTWEQLHAELAAIGMRYEKTGSGATVFVGDVGVKASDVDRNASLAKMQKRLGEYQPAPQHQQVAQREPEPIKPCVPGWKDYITGRKAHYAAKNAAKLAMDKRHEQEREALRARQKARRDELLRGNWKGKGDVLNALRSVLAAEQAAEKAALKERHKREREQWRQRFRPYPDFEQWQRMRGSRDLADQWRYQASEPQRIEGASGEAPTPRDIRAYVSNIVGQYVYYSRRSEGGAGAGGVSFVDKGKIIEIYDWRDRDAILAAMQVAASKFGAFTITGTDEFKAMCAQIAAEHGFKIKNLEMQEMIEREQQKLQQERSQAMKTKQLQQFEIYANAVDAERYRVTSIKMTETGRLAFILDKKNGVTRGFTKEEIALHMTEMIKLMNRGENIYYTPLSDDKHHILIDDMNREKLQKLINDGFKPAVLIESSPNNFQAIITIPKLKSEYDKDVGNRLAERLNKEYGDPKLSGAIHPHRAPGFENRKPKYKREDGSYPEVKLLKAEKRICEKTFELSKEIEREIRSKNQSKEKDAKVTANRHVAYADDKKIQRAIAAYYAHYNNIKNTLLRNVGKIDHSRIDSMIAVRLRMTGHDMSAIKAAIFKCAPTIRENKNHNWENYAERTARYAFSFAATQQIENLTRYKDFFARLEQQEFKALGIEEKQHEQREQEFVRDFGLSL